MTPSLTPALDASVLVLNKLFMAVHIISVRRAFCLLCKELAEVVSLEDGQFATYDFETWREVSEYRGPALPPGRRRLGPDRQQPRSRCRASFACSATRSCPSRR